MRDHSRTTYCLTELTELISAFESEGLYFAVVGRIDNGVAKKFRFGILESGYSALRKILENKPLDTMPGVKYRYFDSRQYCNGTTNNGQPTMSVWIELQGTSLLRRFDVPIELLVNLAWFAELSDLSQASYLTET